MVMPSRSVLIWTPGVTGARPRRWPRLPASRGIMAKTKTQVPVDQSGRRARAYEFFMLGLSLFSIAAFLVEALVPMGEPVHQVFAYADLIFCAAFLVDFGRSVVRAPARLHYLVTWGWLDLVSSIPTLPFLRLARAARIARLVRVLRAVRGAKTVALFATHRRAESAAYVLAFGCLLLVVLGSAAALHVESGSESSIRTAGDAVWWSIGTLTTVGYSDLHPVTAEGRLIGILLMTAGVAVLGTLTGLLASWFLAPQEAGRDAETKALIEEIAALRAVIEERLPKQHP
jgi:voltage-gated potassium channel